MLKIKKGKLNELKKYGFIKVKKDTTTFSEHVIYWYTLCNCEYDCITIFKDRQIYFGLDCSQETHDILYDLIKADLVEKVEE